MGQLVFQATLGGQVNLVGPNTASTYNINVPAVAGTMVTTGDTGSVSSTMLASSLSLTTPNIGVATGTSLKVSAGFYSTSTSSFTYTDGIVMDYTTGLGRISVGTADGLAFYNAGVATTELMRLDSSGNLGIGTSSVTSGAEFQVDNPLANVILSVGKDIPVSLFSRYNDDPALYWKSGTVMRFATTTDGVGVSGFTERMRIDSSGNLLVGNTSQLDGERLLSYRSTDAVSATFANASNTGSYTIQVRNYGTSGDKRLVRFMQGATPSDCGAIFYNGIATVYATSSDYRLKENVKNLTGALEVVSRLKPRSYKWKEAQIDDTGFIAHELQEIFPNSVSGEKDAVDDDGNPVYQGIDTSFLVATLTAAIQEQQALITTLTERITALETSKV